MLVTGAAPAPAQSSTFKPKGKHMDNDAIFEFNKVLYVIAAIAVIVVALDINVWRAVAA